jgi:hypothetical protein
MVADIHKADWCKRQRLGLSMVLVDRIVQVEGEHKGCMVVVVADIEREDIEKVDIAKVDIELQVEVDTEFVVVHIEELDKQRMRPLALQTQDLRQQVGLVDLEVVDLVAHNA